MKTKTERILVVMNVLSWVVFIGLLIQAGATIISYVISLVNPEGAKNLYLGLNLFSLRQSNIWHYNTAVFSMIALLGFKAYTAYLVIKILSKINLTNPFTIGIALLIEKVSYVILGTWIIAMIANIYNEWLRNNGSALNGVTIPENSYFWQG